MGDFARAQKGETEALQGLMRRHIPLVQSLCGRFPEREDAFQQGCLGLLYAIRNFREDAGFAFSTFAVPHILGQMRRAAFHTLGWRKQAVVRRARAYQEQVIKRTGQAPGIRETAAQAGVTPEELAYLLELDRGPQYDETGELLSSLPDPAGDAWLLRFCVRDILERMPGMDGWLLFQRYFRDRSQAELARLLRSSQSRVSRREAAARLDFRNRWTEGEAPPVSGR